MPFAAVLTQGRSLFLRPPVAVLRTEGHIWARSMSSCYGILPIYKPPTHSVKESRFFSANPPQPQRFRVILSSSPCESITRPGQHLRLPRASIIVEMLPGSARDGPLP